jgi:hypothetical protein
MKKSHNYIIVGLAAVAVLWLIHTKTNAFAGHKKKKKKMMMDMMMQDMAMQQMAMQQMAMQQVMM